MNASVVQHPTDQTLSLYALGKVDDRLLEAIDKHLGECPDCRKRVAEMSADSFLVRVRDGQVGWNSVMGPPSPDGTQSLMGRNSPSPIAAETLPPGMADHPDYEIRRELGRGGMGVVYLAHNKLMGRDEVLKVMSKNLTEKPGVLDRFLREIRAVARLRHPNIVTAYSAVRFGESIVFAMEYVEGLDLSRMVKSKGPLPVSHACFFAHQAALGLQHAHEEGLVHRDIKPANLMLSRKKDRATIKILDFGLAKAAQEQKIDGGLTSEGQALGTPDFIAPEQILNAPTADIRADIYSLGGTLYYLLTGRPPFQANSLYDIYQAHISRDAEPMNLIRPEVPAELAALVAKMMAKDPKRRFQAPAEVAQALTPFFKSKGTKVQPETSQAGAAKPKPSVTVERPTPTEPVTVVRSKEPLGSPDSRWDELIDLRDSGPVKAKPIAVTSTSRPRWVWPTVAASALLSVFLIVWLAVTLKVKTADGVIVLKNVPEDAEILVDGDKITFTLPGDDKPVEIRAVPGQRKVEVKKDGFKSSSQEVTLSTGGRAEMIVSLEPVTPTAPAQSKPIPDPDRQLASKTPEQPAVEVGGAGKLPTPPQADDAERSSNGDAIVLTGSWRAEGRELVQVEKVTQGQDYSGTEGEILFGNPALSSYDLHFQAMIEEGEEGFGAIFHRKDKDNFCFVNINKRNKNSFFDAASTLYKGGLRERASKPASLQLGHWYDVRLEVRGADARCSLDGKELFHHVDERFTKGQVGFTTKSSVVRFRDIALTTPQGKSLWDGPPKLPRPTKSTPVILSGAWSIEGEELAQTARQGTCELLLGDTPLESYDFKYKTKILSGRRQFYAFFHNQEGTEGGLVHFGDANGTFIRFDFTRKQGDFPERKTIKKPIELEHWYKIWIKVRGREIQVYLDDKETFHCVNAPFTKGRVGFATWETQARFSDISVTTPDGKEIWKGLPELPGHAAGDNLGLPTPSGKVPDTLAPSHPRDQSSRRKAVVINGPWRVEGGILSVADPGGETRILFEGQALSHYDMTFKAMAVAGNGPILVAYHLTSASDGCLFHIGDAGNTANSIGSAYKEKWYQGPSKPGGYAVGKWIDVRLRVRGADVRFDLDGREWFHHIDERFKAGQVGLGAEGASVRFRDIVITDPKGKEIWKGPPDLHEEKIPGTLEPNKALGLLAGDELQPGSVWATEQNFKFTILERQGEKFKALFEVGKQIREVNGTIKDGWLRWLSRDVRVIAGKPGEDNQGEIKGDKVEMTWSNAGGPILGHFTLRLTSPKKMMTPTDKKAASISGSWRVEGSELVKTDAIDGGEIIFGNPSWSNYDLTFKVKGITGVVSNVVKYHHTGPEDQCIFEIGDGNGENFTYLFCISKGETERLVKDGKAFFSQLGKEYSVRLKVRGQEVTTYLDGKEWFHCVDKRFTKGRVGFATPPGATSRFRDILIRTPEGEDLWKGPPELP